MKKLIALLPALSLVGCDIPNPNTYGGNGSPSASGSSKALGPVLAPAVLTPIGPVPLQPVYHATFTGGSMGCCYVDNIHSVPQPLDASESKVYGQNSTWGYRDGNLRLKVTAPYFAAGLNATVSTGISLSDLNFGGPGTIFSLRATFQNPSGPDDSGTGWAAGTVTARTGNDVDADEGQKRLIVSLRHKRDDAGIMTVVLNVQGISPDELPLTGNQISDKVYSWIFDQKKPYTLELYVDRKTGHGSATLTAGPYAPLALWFTMKDFTADSPIKVTTVGAWVAIANGPTQSATVDVKDFQVSTLPPPCLACARN